jgi:hypothetical protein
MPTFNLQETEKLQSEHYHREIICSRNILFCKEGIIIRKQAGITKSITKQRLGTTHYFEIINRDSIVKTGVFVMQTPNILIKDVNGIKTSVIRHGEAIRNGGTTVIARQLSAET